MLYLSLPQTQGSSYLYVNYLQPFFHTHEADIDATIVRLKGKVYTYLQERFRTLWAALLGSASQAPQGGASAMADSAQPPTVTDPVAGPAQLLGGLWQSYGPSILGQGAGLFAMAGAAAAAQQQQHPQTRPQQSRSVSAQSAQRRKQLEAELAALQNSSGSDSEAPMEFSSARQQRGSDVDLRSRGGQYEEVEVPSDVEGYDVGEAPTRPGDKASWFGWGGAAAPLDRKTK